MANLSTKSNDPVVLAARRLDAIQQQREDTALRPTRFYADEDGTSDREADLADLDRAVADSRAELDGALADAGSIDRRCQRCAGTGRFITYVENGVPRGPGGECYRCRGKGYQTDADSRRNWGYDNYGVRV